MGEAEGQENMKPGAVVGCWPGRLGLESRASESPLDPRMSLEPSGSWRPPVWPTCQACRGRPCPPRAAPALPLPSPVSQTWAGPDCVTLSPVPWCLAPQFLFILDASPSHPCSLSPCCGGLCDSLSSWNPRCPCGVVVPIFVGLGFPSGPCHRPGPHSRLWTFELG